MLADDPYAEQIYVEDVDDDFAASAIQAIGTCAERVPNAAPECLQNLTKLLQSKHGKATPGENGFFHPT